MTRKIIIISLLLILFTSYSASSSRRILHQPFFPVNYSPPPPLPTTQPPSPSPQPQPQPKYPFSSLSPPAPIHHHHNNHRFFPFYTSPPSSTTTTVPSTSLPTFPANISSIIIPSSSSKSHFSKKLLLLSLTLTLLSIAFIAAVLASLLYHRNHNKKPPTSDSLRLFPANLPTSDKPPTLPLNFSTPSSEFLYLGTLVSPLHDHKPQISITPAAASTTLGYNRLGSPELHPLPPLPRQDFHHQHNLQEEDLFSDPKESPVVFQRHKRFRPPSPTQPPPPPPPPPTGFRDIERKEEILKPKLKALHWDKVRASSEKAMVWDRLKFSSFQLNEEMIETLFMASSSKLAPNHRTNEPAVEPMVAENMNQKNRVLDPHKSRNIAILLRAFNLTIDEVCESISQGNVDTLGSELLGSLLKMAPTMEEEVRLKRFDDSSLIKLDPVERFLRSVISIPFAFKRIDAMLYISNFDTEIEYLKGSFETIEMASRELRNSRMFIKLLEAVLMAGNRMNIGTNRGDARAFKLDTLLKLVDVKGTDGKTTLLHFVVQEITRAEGCRLAGADIVFVGQVKQQSELCDEVEFTKRGLEVVSSLGGELSSVKKAATMDFNLLSKEVGRLAMGIPKIREAVSLNEKTGSNKRFSDSMNMFLKKAEHDIVKIEAEERLSLSMVKETTEYFHGSASMDEAQLLRIFMVVRDFLSILDVVCKEVGKINERTTVGRSCARDFPLPLPTSQSLPPSIFPKLNKRQHYGLSDGEDDSTPI